MVKIPAFFSLDVDKAGIGEKYVVKRCSIAESLFTEKVNQRLFMPLSNKLYSDPCFTNLNIAIIEIVKKMHSIIFRRFLRIKISVLVLEIE